MSLALRGRRGKHACDARREGRRSVRKPFTVLPHVGSYADFAMHTAIRKNDMQLLARLEARALERMARALCEHSRQLLAAARERGALGTRESKLQMEVFDERCAQVGELLKVVDAPVQESRTAKLERLVNALECSRGYFKGLAAVVQ